MHRRALLAAGVAAPLMGVRDAGAAVATAGPEWRRFEITTRVALANSAGPAALWLPLAQTASGYQMVLDSHWHGNGRIEMLRDATYGAPILCAHWDDATTAQQVTLTEVVATRDRGPSPAVALSAAERRFWTAATESMPTDGIVRATAERIVAGRSDQRARLRALYDWVVETTWRDPKVPGCGTGNVKAMLESGSFGGKCADINGLMVALARAAGFPARDVYGIRVADSRLAPPLGRNSDVSKAQHCRAEVFLDDAGWFPLDPADVRKVVLEQKLALDSDAVRALRERLFGHWEMNWIGYNSATDIVLPGAAAEQRPNFAFLMYPCAFTASGEANCLDPAGFRYDIAAREISA
jgi:transglutaminase-like putative cysteine protease